MNKDQQKISDAWERGYCKDSVSALSTIGFGPENKSARISYIRSHIHECERCKMANMVKGIEGEIADRLVSRGYPTAKMLFNAGEPSPLGYNTAEYGSVFFEVIDEMQFSREEIGDIVKFMVSVRMGKEV